jgi:hypothetical protein
MVSIGTVVHSKSERFVVTFCLTSFQADAAQDRYAGLSGPGGFRGGFRGGPRGGPRGLRGLRGGYRGGYASQAGAGRDFSNQDLYADYSGPDQQAAPSALRMDYPAYSAAPPTAPYGGAGYVEPEPSQQIMVRNVCCHIAVILLLFILPFVCLAPLVYCQ